MGSPLLYAVSRHACGLAHKHNLLCCVPPAHRGSPADHLCLPHLLFMQKKEIRKGNRPAGDRAPLSTERRSRGGGGAGGAPRAGHAPRQLSITVKGGVSKPRVSPLL